MARLKSLKSRRTKTSPSGESKPREIASRDGTRADTAPAALGYRMPAEWEPHEATWLAWPHERTDWPG
jgi:hypothetical protein